MTQKINQNPKRIMIFGLPGSGKSTFALKLSKQLHLPLYHLDKYFFVDNWVERDKEEFLNIQKSLVDQDKWIIDGNAIRSLEMRYKRADLVIYMCYPRWVCIVRVFKRLFTKDPAIFDRAENCEERVSWKLLTYLWGFDKRVSPILEKVGSLYPATPVHVIKTDKDLKEIRKILHTKI